MDDMLQLVPGMINTIINLTPSIPNNVQLIQKKIQNRIFRINESDVNIYCTLLIRFQKDLEFEKINEMILKSISRYRNDGKDCSYKIKDTVFSFIPRFIFTQPDFTDIGFQEPEYEFYPKESKFSISTPSISGVVIHIFFEQNTKESIVNCQILLDEIQGEMLKSTHIKQYGKFLYLNTENEEKCIKIWNKIQSKYNKSAFELKNQSGISTEIKIRYNELAYSVLYNLL